MKDSSPSALRDLCEELRRLTTKPPSEAGRKKLDEALWSKWDGVRVEAAKVLSQWGDPESVAAMKRSLADIALRPGRGPTVYAIAMALLPHLHSSDVDWAVDLFVHGSRSSTRESLKLLFGAFPHDAVLIRLKAKLAQAHGGTLERAIAHAIDYIEWHAAAEKRQPTSKRTAPPRRKGWLGRPTSPARGKKRPL
jgi:hypothetical protein